jgi:type VI secretion system secreted protein VgrG
MTDIGSRAPRRRAGYLWLAACPVVACPLVAGAIAVLIATQPAVAAVAPVGLGTAGSYAVLAGSTVTNTGLSLISGDLGVSPGSAVTGFPPGIVIGGTIHTADTNATGAQADLTTAYNDAAGRTPTVPPISVIRGSTTLAPGVYMAPSSLAVGGSLTLDAHGDPNAVFIFQAGSTLITDTGTTISLTNGAQACNVFWQVGSSATLNTSTTFQGTILALTSISVLTGDTITGRALARNGAVTLDDDTITRPSCATSPTPTPSPTGTRPTPSPTGTGPTPTPTGTGPTPTPTGTRPTPTPTGTRPTPSPTGTGPTPSPTGTRPTPSPTGTGPTPTPTGTRPTPSPTPTPTGPAPAPTPVGTTVPVTG